MKRRLFVLCMVLALGIPLSVTQAQGGEAKNEKGSLTVPHGRQPPRKLLCVRHEPWWAPSPDLPARLHGPPPPQPSYPCGILCGKPPGSPA
jgi:hypothetical protein